MADSLNSIDLSTYEAKAQNFGQKDASSSSSTLNSDKSSAGNTIETVDFSDLQSNVDYNMNTSSTGESNNNYINKEFLEKYFAKYGDINSDGIIDDKDVSAIQSVLVGKTNGNYDIDGDGQTTAKDVTLLQKYINGDGISGSALNVVTNKQVDIVLETMNEPVSDEEIKKTLANMSDAEYTDYVKDLKLQYDDQIATAKRNKAQTEARYKDIMTNIKTALNRVVDLKYGSAVLASDADVEKEIGMNRAEAKALLDSMQADIDSYDTTISQLETKKNNCDYYGLVFTKGYADYNVSFTDEDQSIFDKSALVQGNLNVYNKTYSYSQYEKASKKLGRTPMNPLQFYECVSKVPLTNPSESKNTSFKDKDVYQAMVFLKDKAPDYYKTYCYLYDQDPSKAEQYTKDIKDELFQLYGQYLASNQLSTLYVKDGENDAVEVVANSLNMSANGLVNGMVKFAEGGVYSLEALATCLGYEGTTQMSAHEYANLYKVYALMSLEDKEKMGLVKKNANGEYVNAIDNQGIDYTIEYSGVGLDKVYQVSEGFGNTLPAVAISMVNPTAGSVALGLSAGGNAYHGSMLEGNGKLASIMYGVFTGVSSALLEKKLGGLTGLSDVQVTSAKTYFQSIAKEVAADQISALADDLYRAEFMGDGFPTTQEGWAEYFEQKKNMAIESAVTAGVMNAPAFGTSVYKKRSFALESKKLGMSKVDIDDAISSYRKSNSSLAKLTDDEIIINYGDKILKNTKNKLNIDDLYTTAKLPRLDDDLYTTAKLPRLDDDMDITAELPQLDDDMDITAELPQLDDDMYTTAKLPQISNDSLSASEILIKDYQNHFSDYVSQGISLEKYLSDNGIDVINPRTKLAAAEAIGDSKLYAIERLKQIRDSGKLSSSKLAKLDGIINKYAGFENGNYNINDILKDGSSFFDRADKKKIKSIHKIEFADNISSNYTYNQQAAIFNYTKCGGFEINGWLNNTTDANGVPWRNRYSSIQDIQDRISGVYSSTGRNMVFPTSSGNIISELDSVIANAKYDTPIRTYRGLKDLYDGNTKIDPSTLKPGDSFTSPGYQSSSIVLENSYVKKQGYDIVLDIIVPPNSGTAAYIENASGVKRYGQMEMLIKRNATMTVTGDPYLQNINGTNKLVVPVIVQ